MAVRIFRVVAAASILAFALTARSVAATYAADDGVSADPLPVLVEPPLPLPEEPPSEPPTTDPAATEPPPADSPPSDPLPTEPPPPDGAPTAPSDAADPTATPAPSAEPTPPDTTAEPTPDVDPPPPDTAGAATGDATDATAGSTTNDVPPVDVPPLEVPPVAVPPIDPIIDPTVDQLIPPEVSGTPAPPDVATVDVVPPAAAPPDVASEGPSESAAASPSTAGAGGSKSAGSDANVTPSKERLMAAPTAEPTSAPGPETAIAAIALATRPERMRPDDGWNAAAAVGAAIAAGVVVTNQAAQGTLTVALEFGRAGGGWAGAIVFNIWLRRQLRERRISQRQLAVLSGVDHSTISRLLRDGRQPSLATATKLVSALRGVGVDPDEPNAASFFERMPEDTVFPARRVEQALRADEQLPEEEVRRLMRIYLNARRRYEPVARGSSTVAASTGTRTARAAPPGRG